MANPTLMAFAASRGMQAGKGLGDAYRMKIFSKLQANAVKDAINEVSSRTQSNVLKIFEAGDVLSAQQEAAFVKSGVELKGSAMDVVSDTLSDAAEAAYIRQREANFELEELAGTEAMLREQGSDRNFIFNSISALLGAGGGFAQDYQSMKFMQTSKGARTKGIGNATDT